MHLLLTRPLGDDGADPLGAALKQQGHRVTHAPLLTIAPVGGMPDLDGVQALIVTSGHALHAVRSSITDAARGLTLFAVGPTTAALAREAGFTQVIAGTTDGAELAGLIREHARPRSGALLHLAGEAIAFDFKAALEPEDFTVRREVVYRADAASRLPEAAVAALKGGDLDGVILMSPRTARIYAGLVETAGFGVEARRALHYCLSAAVARELAPLGAVRSAVARLPNSQEMLALIARDAPDSP